MTDHLRTWGNGRPAAVYLTASLAASCGPVMNFSPMDCDRVGVSKSLNTPHMLFHTCPLALGYNDQDNYWSDIGGYMLRTAEQQYPEFVNDCTQQRQLFPNSSNLDLKFFGLDLNKGFRMTYRTSNDPVNIVYKKYKF